jgi:hypothetical protein
MADTEDTEATEAMVVARKIKRIMIHPMVAARPKVIKTSTNTTN